MDRTMISASGLSKVYQRGREQVMALNNVSLEIKEGEFVAILGPSGSGKSTLLHLLGALDIPTHGHLRIDGVELDGKSEAQLVKIRREKIGFIFQQFFLIPTLTVEENILLPTLYGSSVDKATLGGLIEFVGLDKRRNHLPKQLSGGEMQRVAIARSLVNNPQIVLADEPTGNLDSHNGEKIIELFKKLNQHGVTVVMVTHNDAFAKMADRVIRINDGVLHG